MKINQFVEQHHAIELQI